MVAAKWHTYQVLTKRSDRLRKLLNSCLKFAAQQPHIWWGVSVEDKKYGLPRIEDLQAPSAVRFLSVEPLLEDMGQIDLRGINWVIVGGESGPGARPMQEEWVVSLRDQCRKSGVPFSSSNGAVCANPKQAAAWKAKPMTNFPLAWLIL